MTRPNWPDIWMGVADVLALRSKCSRRQIAAVIVDTTNRPISMGYNGPPAGFPQPDGSSCIEFCPRAQRNDSTATYGNCISIHAEANALLFADRRDFEGGTIYVTSYPCWDCAKMIANSGLSTVVTRYDPNLDAHREPSKTKDMLEECGILLHVLKEEA